MLLWTTGLFLIIEPIVGHVIEPLVYGHSTGLSPVAIVASATFWTALWGPIGLVLATPLTVCLVVLGRHVERLKFLDVMLGDRPALAPPEIFYQRMLAGDPTEAAEKAEEFLKERPLSAYYDEVGLKGLKLAQEDLTRGSLDARRVERIKEAVSELLDDLADEEDQQELAAAPTQDPEAAAAVATAQAPTASELPVLRADQLAPEWRQGTPVICMPGRSGLDEAAALMLTQILWKHGIRARVIPTEALVSSEGFLTEPNVVLVCISYLDTSTPAHMRYAIRRVRRRLPKVQVLLGCWAADLDPSRLGETVKADDVVTTLRDAVEVCLDKARGGAVRSSGEHRDTIREFSAA
jgi:hypothetical protein